MTITTGQYLLNTWNLNGEQCGYALDGQYHIEISNIF
jgi:hypothetical protein